VISIMIRADGDHDIGVAVLDSDRRWQDPFGGVFSADDIAALDAFARGSIDALVLSGRHIYGARVVARFTRISVDFVCECIEIDGSVCKREVYVVTGHDGSRSTCAYCLDCADLARRDYNGETAKIETAS
jgi:hypothetical protein